MDFCINGFWAMTSIISFVIAIFALHLRHREIQKEWKDQYTRMVKNKDDTIKVLLKNSNS